LNRFAHRVVACACSGASLAAQWGWSPLSSVLPPARAETQLAYDLGRGVTVMFSGRGQTATTLTDTWEWNGFVWTQLPVAGPPPRSSAAFGFDPARQRIVMFGGDARSSPPGLLADTWEFDGTSWTQFAVSGPSARMASGIAYDPIGNRMLLFGGGDQQPFNFVVHGDTWSWNGSTWQQLAPVLAPTARLSFGLATNFYSNKIVLHGGMSPGSQFLSDTWAWNGAGWSQLATIGNPGSGAQCGFAFDWSRGVMVRFGGQVLFGSVGNATDTLLLDGKVWVRDQAATHPSQRLFCALAYDVFRSKVVLFGGDNNGTVLGDHWEYTVPPVARWVMNGVPCAGTAGRPHLAPLPAARPVVGGPFGLELTSVRDGPVLFVTGFSTTTWSGVPLPAPLDALGMPGCTAYGSVERCDLATAVLGRATLSLPVPNMPSLVGLTFVNQAVAADPGRNAFGAVVSNAGIGVIGAL